MRNVEERVEDILKRRLDNLGIRRYSKVEYTGNSVIDSAFLLCESTIENNGDIRPDIKLILIKNGSCIPVLIVVRGERCKLEKRDKGELATDISSTTQYAVNGAYQYGVLLLRHSDLQGVICIGVTGHTTNWGNISVQCKAYYVAKQDYFKPQLLQEITTKDWSFLKDINQV